MNVEAEVIATLQSCGVAYSGPIVLDGHIHRVGKNKSGWYIGYSTPLVVCVCGDWKSGISEKFIEARQDITPKDRQRIARQMREAAAQRERELHATHEKAAKDCTNIWNSAGESGSNDYLASKGLQCPINEYGLCQGVGPFHGYDPFGSELSLIVPAVDIDGNIHSLQVIAPGGRKRFYPNGKVSGHFYPIGLHDKPVKILICEGISTALTLYEDTGFPVISAFNANNLAPVAESIRWKYPDADILICGDDDHATEGNPGKTKAIEAAVRCGGEWVLPDFTRLPRGPKDTDFNDLRRLKEVHHE